VEKGKNQFKVILTKVYNNTPRRENNGRKRERESVSKEEAGKITIENAHSLGFFG
jgi:hypothetical protein